MRPQRSRRLMVGRNSVLCFVALLVFILAGFGLVGAKLPEGLVFLMTFDEGSGGKVLDLSGFGNDGTVEGKEDWINGQFGGAFHFDGSTYITVPNNEPLGKLTHPMSVGFWTNPDALGGWQQVVEMDGGAGWKMGFHDSHCLVWTTYHVKDFITATPIEMGEWTHAVATWDGKEAIVYINGEPEPPIAGGGVVDVENEPSLDIGYRRTSAASWYTGGIDELFIFDRVIDQDEVKQMMAGFADMLAVEPEAKLTTAWGAMKNSR
jgi:hypothetical protein